MPGAQVNVAELERFAANLKAYNERLKQSKSQIMSALDHLGQSWDDSQRKKFDESLQQTLKTIDRLSQNIENVELPYLRQKIQAGRIYLGH